LVISHKPTVFFVANLNNRQHWKLCVLCQEPNLCYTVKVCCTHCFFRCKLKQ